jgi:hypothetical protein
MLPLTVLSTRATRARAARLDRSLAVCVTLWVVVRLYQISVGCSGEGNDVELYQRYAGDLRSGAAAARDFRPEYPPGALTLFTLPALAGGDAAYQASFGALMALFDLGACLLVFQRARLHLPAPSRGPLHHAILYLAMSTALWPVLYARFDIVPGTLVLAALHALDRLRDRLSATLLGVAGAIKLWPFALVPLWLVWRLASSRPGDAAASRTWRREFAHAAAILALVVVGAGIATLPVLPMLAGRLASALQFHAARGLQIESTWATAALVLDRLGLADVTVEEAFGATQIAGRLPGLLCALSQPVTLLLVTVPVVILAARARRARNRKGNGVAREDSRSLEHAALAVMLGVMIGAKVLSPQFMLWIVPLLALVAEGGLGWMLAFLTAALTTEIYPHLYPALMAQAPGHGHALVALATRNALLVGWYVTAVRRLAKQESAVHRLEGGAGTLHGPILPVRPSGERRRAVDGGPARVSESGPSGDLDVEAQ